ncbi:hypothetical protein HN014_14265 [Aquimarina sp. TRL1]|uniref:TolB family protein n=1 Tax=Aquimarina sp. (strain TRL1) TaxID=2736252 RepID=UPI0015895B3B|nr:PD40 domain-containing protein [Aquimarina sp. TRL1]QKX06019.1 hypothetical protein HN014_14265 [Aquimarina sp. TRL1]
MKSYYLIFMYLLSLSYSFSQEKNAIEVTPVLPEITSELGQLRDFTMAPTQDEAYFTMQSFFGEISAIVKITKKGTTWSAPSIAPFSGQFHDMEPMFSPDGLQLYFVSNRNTGKINPKATDYDIWFIRRENKNAPWSDPINLGAPVNTEKDEFYPSIATNGNLYYTSTATPTKGQDDIFMSEWKNNSYTTPISLSEAINTKGMEFNAFVAPDESFILYTAYKRKGGIGSGDLYISYKNKEGQWTPSENMTQINSSTMDYCPFYDTKTKTIYFTSKKNTINPHLNKPQNIKQLTDIIFQYENGLSRIYSARLDILKK